MAASQAIVQAAKLAYTPHQIDYSGYMQGILSVSEMLMNKAQSMAKQRATDKGKLEKMKQALDTDFTPWDKAIEHYVDNAPGSVNEKLGHMKALKQATLDFEDAQQRVSEMVEAGLSDSLDPDIQNYLISWANGGFNQPIKYTDKSGVESTYNINFALETEGNKITPKIVGPKGDVIDMQALINLTNTTTKVNDGVEVTNVLNKFLTQVSDKKNTSPSEFKALKDEALTNIKNLFKHGVVSKAGKVQISSDHVKKSFMFDQTFFQNGNEISFLDWYMEEGIAKGKVPKQIVDEFSKVLKSKGLKTYGALSKKMQKIIIQDIIKYDDDIDADLSDFIQTVLNTGY